MTDLKTLKLYIKLMVDNDLTELDLEGEGEKIRLKRAGGIPEVQLVSAPVQAAPTPAQTATPAEAAPAEGTEASPEHTINSPMVGTFYAAPSPDAKPFVGVGDTVGEDSVICIIEAMKVFNEVKAEKPGTIVRSLVENGQSVEFGQPLFELKPA